MFALGMHFRREKEKQEAEKRKAKMSAERTRKKTVDETSRNRQSFGNDVKTTTGTGSERRPRSNSNVTKRYSYPASATRPSNTMTTSTDNFGKMDLNGPPPPPYDSLTTSLYLPGEEPNQLNTTQIDNLQVPSEVKKVKKCKDSSSAKGKRNLSKSPKLSKQDSGRDLNDSSASVVSKNGTTSADESPLLM